jgi:RimJ/RimL family protein N-acetyltransferase
MEGFVCGESVEAKSADERRGTMGADSTGEVNLRAVEAADLELFFEWLRDPESRRMAAFGAENPDDRAGFMARWTENVKNPENTMRTVERDGRAVGFISSFTAPWSGKLEVSYWIAREFWGRGIATVALKEFLAIMTTRPVHAQAATDNAGSLRVLEKCGFKVIGGARSFTPVRGEEVEEFVLALGDAGGGKGCGAG